MPERFHDAHLEAFERYERLRERRAALEERAETAVDDLAHEDAAAAFRDLN